MTGDDDGMTGGDGRTTGDDDGSTAADDLGEPIALLADLEEPVSSRLRDRVRNSIHRRHFGGDLLDFTILTPGMVLVTYVTGLFGALVGAPDHRNDQTDSTPTRSPREEP